MKAGDKCINLGEIQPRQLIRLLKIDAAGDDAVAVAVKSSTPTKYVGLVRRSDNDATENCQGWCVTSVVAESIMKDSSLELNIKEE